MDILVAKALLEDLSTAERNLLTNAERGIALTEVDESVFKSMIDRSLVRIVPFENSQASDAIMGIVLTEDGRKVVQARTVYETEKLEAETQKADARADAKVIDATSELDEERKHVAEDKATELVVTDRPRPQPEQRKPERKPPIR